MISLPPLAVDSSRVWRPFVGGRELDRLAGLPNPADGHFSEEWLLSTVPAVNPGRDEPDAGLSFFRESVPGITGRICLADAIAADPGAFLGVMHADLYGEEMGVLVKLIDSRDRLRLQVHPDKAMARRLFGTEFGKTECWHVLGLRGDGDEPPRLYLGFREGISREAWRDAFARQDREAMFSMLHAFVPSVGETYVIPGGVPHAIGAGCLVAEVQEPSDMTIRLERSVPGGPTLSDEAMHQGLGFEAMFDCFYYDGRSQEETLACFRIEPRPVAANESYRVECLVAHDQAAGCFAMERIDVATEARLAPSPAFSGLYVAEGVAALRLGGVEILAKKHEQFFLPPSSDALIIANRAESGTRLLRFYGPQLNPPQNSHESRTASTCDTESRC